MIKLSNAYLPANATKIINYQANLPQLPKTANYNSTVYNSELLEAADFQPGSTTAATTGTAAITGTNAANTLFTAGDTLTISAKGVPVVFDFYNGGTYTGSNVGIDISTGTINDKLAAMQTGLRTYGGGAAASATIGLNGANNFRVTLGSDYHAGFTVNGTGGTAAALGLTYPVTSSTPTRPALNTITADQADDFVANSVSGGAITVYASNGAPVNVQMRWAKVDSAAAGGTDKWNLFYLSDSAAVGGSPAWTNTGQVYEFGSNGSLVPPGVPTTTINNLTVNGVRIGDVELAHQTNGVSQFADVNGTVTVSTLNQNGYGAGEFLSVAITDSGRVVATYSNGERIEMAQVVTAQFNGLNSLKRLDGGVYQATSESGEPIFDLSGSGIIGGALEASNTDISDEFTKLIITQQAYSAGTRIVSTADEMLQEALNMVR